jgi:site-specific DNA-adenine methylase
MKDILLFGRLGNKENDIKFFNHLLPLDVLNIVEPFGGTFAVTRKIYNDDKYIKYVNDNDKQLFKIYHDPDGYKKMIVDFNNYLLLTTLEQSNGKKYGDTKKLIEYINNSSYDDDLKKSYIANKIIRGSFCKMTKSTNTDKFINIMKKINFSCEDWETFINIHKTNDNTFIFLDPPYLFSDNSTYSAQSDDNTPDMTDILYKIYEIFKDNKTKARIMLIINDLKILRWLYKDYIKGSYTRIYQLSKKKSSHLIICNY